MKAVGASERIFELLNRTPQIKIIGNLPANDLKGQISFENIDFTYPNRQNKIFDQLNLKIDGGKVNAVVGPSGSGKSSLVSLLVRFYDPLAGKIDIDGNDIQKYDVNSLRSQISVVSQDVMLFSGTIKDNIGYVLEKPSMDDIEAAAKQANAHGIGKFFENSFDFLFVLSHRILEFSLKLAKKN